MCLNPFCSDPRAASVQAHRRGRFEAFGIALPPFPVVQRQQTEQVRAEQVMQMHQVP
jgi:hypothetical protein